MARLSLCLLAVVITAGLLTAPMAHAEKPMSPKLLATDPSSSEASPAISVTPTVFGEAEPEEGIIIEVVKPSWIASGVTRGITPKHPTQHPTYEIVIFNQTGCQGSVVGRGSAEALEGSGISVTVAENAETMLSAEQINPSEPSNPSPCSSPFSYWQGDVSSEGGSSGGGGSGSSGNGNPSGQPAESVGPGVTTGKPEPPHLHMSPRAIANDGVPAVAGSAPGAASVQVFDSSSCSGSPVAKGSAAQLAAGLQVQVADNTTTTFSAVSIGGQRSDCSSPVTYVEDSTPPRTRITMAPGAKTRKRKAIFRFTDITEDPPGTTFRCKVDRGKWRPCSSPFRLSHLHLSRYVVRVRATDLAGNVEPKAVKRTFKVVRRQ